MTIDGVTITTEVTPRGAFIYANGEMFAKAEKSHQLIRWAIEATAGLMIFHVPWVKDPIKMHDAPWLLRFASRLNWQAATMIEEGN